jgi:hypothetical protein
MQARQSVVVEKKGLDLIAGPAINSDLCRIRVAEDRAHSGHHRMQVGVRTSPKAIAAAIAEPRG